MVICSNMQNVVGGRARSFKQCGLHRMMKICNEIMFDFYSGLPHVGQHQNTLSLSLSLTYPGRTISTSLLCSPCLSQMLTTLFTLCVCTHVCPRMCVYLHRLVIMYVSKLCGYKTQTPHCSKMGFQIVQLRFSCYQLCHCLYDVSITVPYIHIHIHCTCTMQYVTHMYVHTHPVMAR